MNNKEHNKITLADDIIANKIYLIRNKKVMSDSDLAELYGVETRRLNEQVKRNIKRFPEDFMFQLSEQEFKNLKSQFATSSWGGRRIPPYVFTEQGVAMLSGVLNSDRAINVNIQIMRTFTKLREMSANNLSLKLEIEEIKKKLQNQDKNIELVFTYLDELIDKQENPKPRTQIGYKKQK
ncbi:MAG: ORF6N domain-containing protein [Bacteroidales bacterium]|nr:ORF6N domain-containing protein [Bacteroidales bacterium]